MGQVLGGFQTNKAASYVDAGVSRRGAVQPGRLGEAEELVGRHFGSANGERIDVRIWCRLVE